MKRSDLVSSFPRLYVKNRNIKHQNCGTTAFVNEHYVKNKILLTGFCESLLIFFFFFPTWIQFRKSEKKVFCEDLILRMGRQITKFAEFSLRQNFSL